MSLGVPDPSQPEQLVSSQPVLWTAGKFIEAHEYTLRVGPDQVRRVPVVADAKGSASKCAMDAVLVLKGHAAPRFVFKRGDTRASRVLRGEPYVKLGMIGGRKDKNLPLSDIGLEEIAEEVGGRVVPGTVMQLGKVLTPTMAGAPSAELDQYNMAVIDGDHSPIEGDGGGMELTGLMGRTELSADQALKAMDNNEISEGARARVAYGRALDQIGYIPALKRWVSDLPESLRERYQTLGLGDVVDVRAQAAGAKRASVKRPEAKAEGAAPSPYEARVDRVKFEAPLAMELEPGVTYYDTRYQNVAHVDDVDHPVNAPVPFSLVHLDYDLAKVAVYYVDPEKGPMVRMTPVERPNLAAAALAKGPDPQERTDLTRLDTAEGKVPLPPVHIAEDGSVEGVDPLALGQGAQKSARSVAEALVHEAGFGDARVQQLGQPAAASPGQTDLRYHFYAAQVPPPAQPDPSFMPLAEAIRLCRANGDGDANTEALLQRLATATGWIPNLGMSIKEAKAQLKQG